LSPILDAINGMSQFEALAKPAIDAVKSGEIKFCCQKKWVKPIFQWMNNIQDCVYFLVNFGGDIAIPLGTMMQCIFVAYQAEVT